MREEEQLRKAVGAAMQLIGTRWVQHGDTPEGMDCWGLLRYSFRLLDIELPFDPHAARRLFTTCRDGTPMLFDVGYFRIGLLEARHVGLVVSKREILHAADPVYGVSTMRLTVMHDVELLRYKGLA